MPLSRKEDDRYTVVMDESRRPLAKVARADFRCHWHHGIAVHPTSRAGLLLFGKSFPISIRQVGYSSGEAHGQGRRDAAHVEGIYAIVSDPMPDSAVGDGARRHGERASWDADRPRLNHGFLVA